MPGSPTSHHWYFGSRFLKIYISDLIFSRAHILRTLLNIQAGEGPWLDAA